MNTTYRTRTATLFCVASLALTGCADVMSALSGGGSSDKNKRTPEEVDAARQKKDFQTLSDICMVQGTNTRVETMDAACKAAVDVLTEQGDLEKLDAICRGAKKDQPFEHWRQRHQACEAKGAAKSGEAGKAVAAASCETIVATFDQHKTALTDSSLLGREAANANFVKAGQKMAECGLWDHVIEHMAHWGQDKKGPGFALISALAKGGTNWEDRFFAYTKSHAGGQNFAFKSAEYFLRHYFDHLVDSGKLDCKRYIAVADKTPDIAFGPFNWYFRKSNCTGAAEVIAKRLGSERHKIRAGVCQSLGMLGSKKKHLAKVERLAKSDPYFWIKTKDDYGKLLLEPIKIYDVRSACAAAANKLAVK